MSSRALVYIYLVLMELPWDPCPPPIEAFDQTSVVQC